jgi:GTPase SAR1 family protein
MGCCESNPEKKTNNKVSNDLKREKLDDQNLKKLLFLGSGGSGKSTLFKQLRTIHGIGFLDKDRMGFRDHIYSQIIEQMKCIVECIEELRDELPDEFGHLQLSECGEKAADFIDYVRNDMDVDDAVADNVEILWKEVAVQEVFENRARLKLDDSSSYFFNQVRRIATRSYIPTDKDILLVRHRTTGVIEQTFDIKGTTFHVFDVGGQRSERKKWIHCFEHVTAVIFVASLSCYDEVMFEDDNQNAMHDSICLFEHICNLRWFMQTSMILFLNKKDLFADKIQKIPLSMCFEDYDEVDDYDNCVQYIRDQFESRNKTPAQKQIYSHVTCATDKSNVEKVFGDVQHIVINTSLQQGGLI